MYIFSLLSLFLLNYLPIYNTAFSTPTFSQFYEEAGSNFQFMKDVFRTLHQHPETSFQEKETSTFIQEFLKEIGVHFTSGWAVSPFNSSEGGTGVVAQIGTGNPPCIAFRADIDALPIEEAVDIPYKSQHPGKMHACGHDSHTAMLLGAAKILKAHESELVGTVKLIFQPAEEGGGGAILMIKEGILEQFPPIQAIYGFHITPDAETGAILSNYGPITAAANIFDIVVKGKGGHAAKPYSTIDPIATSVSITQSLYTMNARELYFQKSKAGVITVANLYTGNTASFNIIPTQMEIKGTIRALTQDTLHFIMRRMEEIVNNTSAAFHTESTLKFYDPKGLVPTFNDPDLYNFFSKVAPQAAVDNKLGERLPSLGGEDFAYFSQAVPSLLTYLGIGSGHVKNYTTNVPYHTPYFVMDENLFPRAAAFYSYLAFETLENYFNGTPQKTINDEL